MMSAALPLSCSASAEPQAVSQMMTRASDLKPPLPPSPLPKKKGAHASAVKRHLSPESRSGISCQTSRVRSRCQVLGGCLARALQFRQHQMTGRVTFTSQNERGALQNGALSADESFVGTIQAVSEPEAVKTESQVKEKEFQGV